MLLSEHVHASVVLAALAAGLLVGNAGWTRAISAAGRGHVLAFWEYAAYLANSLVFILIGEQEARQANLLLSTPALVAVGFVLLGRIVAVYPICAVFGRSILDVDRRYQLVLVWGGLRVALALALVLALPDDLPERREIVSVAFAVVAFSIFVQGLTMPWLIGKLGLLKTSTPIATAEDAALLLGRACVLGLAILTRRQLVQNPLPPVRALQNQ